MEQKTRILRLPDVKYTTGLSPSTIYQHMKSGLFPQCIKIGPRCIGWLEGDIQNWINSRFYFTAN
jgi:prophage regulatory protein